MQYLVLQAWPSTAAFTMHTRPQASCCVVLQVGPCEGTSAGKRHAKANTRYRMASPPSFNYLGETGSGHPVGQVTAPVAPALLHHLLHNLDTLSAEVTAK